LNSNETILSDGSAFVATSIGGTFSNTGPSVAFNHNGSATGGSLVTAPATDPINFADLQTQMQQQSAFLLSTQPTLTPGTPGQNNTTVLDASGGQSLYVFTITEAQFSAGAINVVTGGSNPTVVINVVDGAGGVYRAGGTFLYNGQQYFSNEITNHVLFNFPDATSLNTASGEFPASILAPYAALTASTLDGTIIVAQATSLNGEVHNIEFDGTLPTPTPPSTPAVPEPGTLALVGTGILSVAGKLRRKK
jgi:choice-of-anchor A domain-containing protein